MIISI